MFNNFPYTNFHNLNLDWIVKTVKLLFNKAVFSINNIEPDEEGNVTITGAELGAIGTVNNIAPVDGNVTLTASDVGAIATGQGVTKVNGFGPDSSGNVLSGTVRSINGISPTSLPTPGNVVLNASDVGALPSTIDPVETVNGISPDANGNVNVGTVKSVNGSAPDAQGNVNLPTVAGVTSVNGIGPDSNGNVEIGLNRVEKIYVNASSGNDSNDGTQNFPVQTIAKAIQIARGYNIRANNGIVAINIANGIYPEVLDVRRMPFPIQLVFDSSVTIGGFVFINCECYISLSSGTLTVKRFPNITYPFGKNLIHIGAFGSPRTTWHTNIELISDDNTYIGIHAVETSTLYVNALTFTGTFNKEFDIMEATIINCNSITAPTTNIGRLQHCSIIRTKTINNGTSASGTTIDSTSKVEFL